MKAIGILLIIVLSLESCGLFRKAIEVKHPLISRYDSLIGYKEDTAALLQIRTEINDMAGAVKDNGSKPTKTLFDLTGQGQAHLEELFAKKDSRIDSSLIALANAKFQEKVQEDNIDDRSVQNRQLSFDITQDILLFIKGKLTPADRIEDLRIEVTLVPDPVSSIKFAGWDQVTTKYGQLNIGGVSFGSSKSLTINPSATVGTVTGSLGSYNKTDSFQEGDSLISQFVSLSGYLSDSNFVLEMNSAPTTTLKGRTSVNVTLKAITTVPKYLFSFSNMINPDNQFNERSKIKIKKTMLLLPQMPARLDATLTCSYLIRHVVRGQNTYMEGDDLIEYYHGKIINQPIHGLLVKRAIAPRSWVIRRGSDILKIEDNVTGEQPELLFSTDTDALLFKSWLNSGRAGELSRGLIIGGFTILGPGSGDYTIENITL